MESILNDVNGAGVDLTGYNTLRVNSKARKLVEFKHSSDLNRFFAEEYLGEKYIALGGGSNILFKADYEGTILHSVNEGIEFLSGNRVKAYAGVNWDFFVKCCTNKGYVGLEPLSLIPGSVGAAPVQNIGAYGAEVSEFIDEVECYDPESRSVVTLTNAECSFSYRSSIFKQKTDLIVVSVVFNLYKDGYEKDKIEKDVLAKVNMIISFARYVIKSVRIGKKTGWKLKMNFDYVRNILALPIVPSRLKRWMVVNIRKRNMPDPDVIANVGCFFKNPIVDFESYSRLDLSGEVGIYEMHDGNVKVSAGDLIKACKLNGFRKDGVYIDINRPLIVINESATEGRVIHDFTMLVQKKVESKTGILIEPEVVII